MAIPQHSKEFIAEMTEKLKKERERLEEELSNIGKKRQGGFMTSYPEYGRHEDENADEISDFAVINATKEALEERLRAVIGALGRIKKGIYGVKSDGALISQERLRANPAAISDIKR